MIEATQDNELILAAAEKISMTLRDGDFVSSKAKARATAAWSSLMLVYLLNKVHAHLIHSGPVVAGLFMESAMADPKWSSLMHSVAPNLMQKEVIDRLEAMRTANQQHPKLLQLRAIVAQHSMPSGNGEGKLAIILVKSSVSFPDISKAVYGLSVACESMAAADLDRAKRPSFTVPQANTPSVWITTEQAMLQLLASHNAPPAEVLEAALVVLLTKPGAGMQMLLERGSVLKHTIVLDTMPPFIESEFVLSGAKSYSSQVHVQVPLEKLWADAQEDAAAHMVLHRSVKLVVYVHEHLLQRRDLVQSLLEENVHTQDLACVACDIVVSRFKCIVIRTVHELFGDNGNELDDDGVNSVVTLMVELSRAFDSIVLLVEMNAAPADARIDAAAWIKLYSLFKSYGSSVKVVQVSSADQLALSIRIAIEQDCGSREAGNAQRPQQQPEAPEFTSLDALKTWEECLEREPSSDLRFLCAWPSLNPVSAELLLNAMHNKGLGVDQLIDVNSDQFVLDVVHEGLLAAGMSARILEGLRTTAEAVVASQRRRAEEEDSHQLADHYAEVQRGGGGGGGDAGAGAGSRGYGSYAQWQDGGELDEQDGFEEAAHHPVHAQRSRRDQGVHFHELSTALARARASPGVFRAAGGYMCCGPIAMVSFAVCCQNLLSRARRLFPGIYV